jgi:hypothetical protein
MEPDVSLDPFSAVAVFLAAVELCLGGVILFLGWREFRRPDDPVVARRRPLSALAAGTLVVTALAAVPLFFLMLDSWVPRWPGLLCIEGVRRIGTAAIGPSRFLPSLISVLDVLRPMLLFAAGAWLVLRRHEGARRGATTAALMGLGLLGCIDAALTTAFVVLPRDEIRVEAGCCVGSAAAATLDDGLSAEGGGPASPSVPGPAFAAGSAVLGCAALTLRRRRRAAGTSAARATFPYALLVLVGVSVAAVPFAVRYLISDAAPTLMGLPFHHCAWCAFIAAPESAVGALLFVAAVFCTGWSLLVRLATASTDDASAPRNGSDGLLATAAFGFLGTAGMALTVGAMA